MAETSAEKHTERSVRILLRVRGNDDENVRRAARGGGARGVKKNTKWWWSEHANDDDGSSRDRRRRERSSEEEGTMLRQGEESGELLCDNYENANENGASALPLPLLRRFVAERDAKGCL